MLSGAKEENLVSLHTAKSFQEHRWDLKRQAVAQCYKL